MTRPTILDLDLVVVPREATLPIVSAYSEKQDEYGISHFANARDVYPAMLSASPYPTAWDDVRKYVEGLEADVKREANLATTYASDCMDEQKRAEVAEVRAEVAERQLSEIAGHMDSECDSDSILHVVREAEADRDIYKDRAEAAEARIAELEKRLVEKGYIKDENGNKGWIVPMKVEFLLFLAAGAVAVGSVLATVRDYDAANNYFEALKWAIL